MNIVENVKNLRRSALDALIPQRFVFHHIPKCGGTSVGRALRKRCILSQATVTPESSFRAFEAFTGRADVEQMLIDVLDIREQMLLYHMFEDVRCISLHVRFSQIAFERFHDKYKFVTVLRDPVRRFLSHYRWSHARIGAHAHISDDFVAFLESPRARRLGATYVEYLCGLPKDTPTDSAEAIAAAVENLRKFAVVGLIENVPRFEMKVRDSLGLRVRIGHENAGNRQSGEEVQRMHDPTLIARVEELCRPDIAIWNAFNAMDQMKS